MFFIIGITPKHKHIGKSNVVCPACGRRADLQISKEYSVFTLFFIPLIPFGASYYAHCAGCGSVMSLSKDKGKAFEGNPGVVIYDGDLQLIQNNSGPACPSCGAKIIVSQNFCYNCGNKL